MATNQITLTPAEMQVIQAIGQKNGKSYEEIAHEAIAQFLLQHKTNNRLNALRQARGIWQDRDDIPNMAELRKTWERL